MAHIKREKVRSTVCGPYMLVKRTEILYWAVTYKTAKNNGRKFYNLSLMDLIIHNKH